MSCVDVLKKGQAVDFCHFLMRKSHLVVLVGVEFASCSWFGRFSKQGWGYESNVLLLLYLLEMEKFPTIPFENKKRFTKFEIWWFKSERLDKRPCGFYWQRWRLSDDEWTLLPFSTKLLLSVDVSEPRGDAPSLTPVSGTISLKPLGGNSVTCSGRVNQSGRLNYISKTI